MTLATSLPAPFYQEATPGPFPAATYAVTNQSLAHDLGFAADYFERPEILSALSGNAPYEDFKPVALAYAGHQFGGWNPRMGDGRAHLIATLTTNCGDMDLQLKGSGPTPFARNGDGYAGLGPMLRECLVSEAMAGLGIPTTRTLAVVATGEQVHRRRAEPGAIVARVARSHVRVGTFQYAAAHLGPDHVAQLVEYEIARSYPALKGSVTPALDLLRGAITRQAALIARWMCVGFIHGVMNTDNMAISGETIDFGPCAFMDTFHPKKVFSSIDQYGRYAWDQQPAIALWNLTRFAEAVLPLLHKDKDEAVTIARSELEKFYPQFEDAFESGMIRKFGITMKADDDSAFIADMLRILMDEKLDFTLFFRKLSQGDVPSQPAQEIWKKRLAKASPDYALMQKSNPIYIARNHQVEAALREAEAGNMTRVGTLANLLKSPFTEQQNMAGFEAAPLPEEEVTQTFCGT